MTTKHTQFYEVLSGGHSARAHSLGGPIRSAQLYARSYSWESRPAVKHHSLLAKIQQTPNPAIEPHSSAKSGAIFPRIPIPTSSRSFRIAVLHPTCHSKILRYQISHLVDVTGISCALWKSGNSSAHWRMKCVFAPDTELLARNSHVRVMQGEEVRL